MKGEGDGMQIEDTRHRSVPRPLQWLAGGLFAILLVLFYINSQGISVEQHQQITQGFERLHSLHHRFLEMLVASHAGLLSNYDPLVDTLADIRELKTQLPDRLQPAARERLTGAIALYDRLLGQLVDKGEELKSHNSVLRNSLSYLPIGVSQFLSENAARSAAADMNTLLMRALRQVQQYNLPWGRQSRPQLVQTLEELQEVVGRLPDDLKRQAQMLLRHLQIGLDFKDQVDNLLRSTMRIPVDQAIGRLANGYMADYSASQQRAAYYRQGLFWVSALLVVWVAVMLIRLSRLSERLRESNDRLNFHKHALDEHAIVSVTDVRGNILEVNEQFCEISGYAREELVGQNHRMVKSDEHPPALFREMWRTIASGRTWHGELKNRAKDGSHYWVASTIVPFMGRNGKPFQYISIRTDISRRKRTEDKLREEQRFLEGITDAMGEGMYVVDDAGICVFINREAEKILGWKREELLGKCMHDLIHHHDAHGRPVSNQECLVNRSVQQGYHFRSDEEVFFRPDGTPFPVSVSAVPLRDGDRIVGSVTVFQNISERLRNAQDMAKAREAAEVASQAKSEFLANMSHEIRTPMNAIIGMTHLALQTDLSAGQRNYVEKAHRSAESLLGLINDILDFSKIEAGKLDIETIGFDLQHVFDDLANVLGFRAEEKGLDLQFELAPDVPRYLLGDPMRLGQILLNLGNNAIKFTETGEVVIAVSLRRDNQERVELEFSVKDTGIGIPSDKLDQLFGSFNQVDVSTTRKYGGTGLGLAISKQLAQLMDGRIEVESTTGVGSTFCVVLPFGRSLAPVADTGTSPGDGALQGLRGLIVDDSTSSQIIFETMLRSKGVEVDVARNGYAAMRYLATAGQAGGRPYDFLLVDWRMGGMDGVALIEEGKDILGSELPPVIMTTAYARSELEQILQDRDITVDAILSKPVAAEQLAETVASVLGTGSTTQRRGRQRQDRMTTALRGAHILLVEDNEFNQEVALALLEQQGIRADLAVDGEEALRMVQAHDYDGVLMDCQMPVMDGYEATRAIRRLPGRGDLPIIAMTANAMREDIAQALASGMNDHIAKPINVRDMFATMERWIRPAGVAASEGSELAGNPDSGADNGIFSGMEGIDVRQGLSRVGGSQEIYLRLLHKFADNQGGATERARDALQAGDREQLERIFHTLKGTAGSIGAIELQRLAADLEVRIKQAAHTVSAQDFDELECELHRVLQQLGELPHSLGARSAPGSGENVERLLETLQQQLDDFDTAASETLMRLSSALQEGEAAEALRRIEQALSRYDFDAASEIVSALGKEYKENVASD